MIRFEKLIREATAFVTASPQGILVLGWRLRLWEELNRSCPANAHLRRATFACVVAAETRAAWLRADVPDELLDLPERLLASCKSCLEGRSSKAELADLRSLEFPRVERAAGLVDAKGYGVAVATAAYACIGHVLGEDDAAYSERDVTFDGEPSLYQQARNEDRYPTINDTTFDWESWESHVFASWVVAGEGQASLDTKLLRAFWIRWLQVGFAEAVRADWTLETELSRF